jgi:hypothetical protein
MEIAFTTETNGRAEGEELYVITDLRLTGEIKA